MSGAPWVLLNGLKWPPAALQPFLRSPIWWTWKPWSPGDSPSISPLKLDLMKISQWFLFNNSTYWVIPSLDLISIWPLTLPYNIFILLVKHFLFWCFELYSLFQNDQNCTLQSLLEILHLLLLKSELFFLWQPSPMTCIKIAWQENGLDVNSWLATIHKHKLLPHLTNVCIMPVQFSAGNTPWCLISLNS